MSQDTPRYFYITHLHVSHSLKLQLVVDAAKAFRNYHPDCYAAHTKPVNNFIALIVTSDTKISSQAIASFENKVTRIEGVGVIFTHSTNTATKDQKVVQDFPPTFVFSGCYGLDFSRWDYWFGKVKKLEDELEKILNSINGGAYYLLVRRKYMALVLESPEPFQSEDIHTLFDFIEKGPPFLLTSISNFPTS